MAIKRISKFQQFLESIFAYPVLASLLVGGSIIILGEFIVLLGNQYPLIQQFKFLVPFIPPFFITTQARKIHRRNAAYDFIADAEPIIYLGFLNDRPQDPEQLMQILPHVVSDATARHLKMPISDILNSPILTPARFPENERRRIFKNLLQQLQPHSTRAVLSSQRISATIPASNRNQGDFILNAVLRQMKNRWKVQMTLIPVEE